jgi:Protein of unknown function (DUF2442)
MKSEPRGKPTSDVEVSNVSPRGIWLLLDRREVFLSFAEFPWFRDATIAQIAVVERPHPHHLHWPALDVDLAVDSLDHPERYPLMSRKRPQPRPAPRQTGPSKRGQRRSSSMTRG